MTTKPVVALIEDEPLQRMPLARALDDAGFEVVSAAYGPEGLAMLGDPGIDAAIVDIRLPGPPERRRHRARGAPPVSAPEGGADQRPGAPRGRHRRRDVPAKTVPGAGADSPGARAARSARHAARRRFR